MSIRGLCNIASMIWMVPHPSSPRFLLLQHLTAPPKRQHSIQRQRLSRRRSRNYWWNKALQQPEDLRTTLFVNYSEAQQGSTRIVTLPGNRRMSIPVPKGVRDGEQFRFVGQGLPSPDGGPPGDVVITIMYRQTRQISVINPAEQPPVSEIHPLEEI